MKRLFLALQFLTIIPIRIKGDVTEKDVGRSAVFFPVVGMVQGLIVGCAAWLLTPVFSEDITAGLIVAILALTNGGFHLDGLADTFDAVAVKSCGDREKDREKRLAVMKDSTTGAVGVIAIVLIILLKYLFIKGLLLAYDGPSTSYLLFLMPLFSKWAMLPPFLHGRAARETGLGKTFIAWTTPGVFITATAILVAVYSVVTFSLSFLSKRDALSFLILVCVMLYAFAYVWTRFCSRRFGGFTGDNSGAASEICDLLYLGIAYLWM